MREAVEQAERIAGLNIEDVWAGFSSGGLVSDDCVRSRYELGGQRIEQADIDELLSAGGAPRDRSRGAHGPACAARAVHA